MTEYFLRTLLALKMGVPQQQISSQQPHDFILAMAESRPLVVPEAPQPLVQYFNAKVVEQRHQGVQATDPNIVFEASGDIVVSPSTCSILEAIELRCKYEESNLSRILVPKEEYMRVLHAMHMQYGYNGYSNGLYQDEEQESHANNGENNQNNGNGIKQQYEEEDDEDEEQQEYQANPSLSINGSTGLYNNFQSLQYYFGQFKSRKRGRPKGSKNRKKNHNQSYSDSDDQMGSDKKRGRGRPKGSRNKKNILRMLQQQQIMAQAAHIRNPLDFRSLFTAHLAKPYSMALRRHIDPKGLIKIQSPGPGQEIQGHDGMVRRGKGRPKGSKNKLKLENGESDDHHRGITAMNDPQETAIDYPVLQPMMETEKTSYSSECCPKCQQKSRKLQLIDLLKKKLLDLQRHQALLEPVAGKPLANIIKDLQVERRENVFLIALRSGSIPLINLYLNYVGVLENSLRCVWEAESRIERTAFTVKTRREAISKSGKQGMCALLHDAELKSRHWWEYVGVQRLMESLPSGRVGTEVIQSLFTHSPMLEVIFLQNIPNLVRCGNHQCSSYLLKLVVPSQYSIYGYSKQHLDCLHANTSSIHYKKANILKQNVSTNFCSPIHCASINPNCHILELLTKEIAGYEVGDSLYRKPIHYASASSTTKSLQVLLSHSGDLKSMDKYKMTPLMIAVYYGRVANMKLILSHASDANYVNFKSDHGFSALHYAVARDQEECAKLLLECAAVDFNLETKDKQTALHLACATGNLQLVRALLAKGAPIEYYDKFKRTPLIMAIRNNNHLVFNELITSRDTKYYRTDTSLNSALHFAAAYGNLPVIRHLWSHVKQAKNKRLYYPWEIAVGKGHLGCARMLQEQPEGMEDHKFHFENNIFLQSLKIIDGTGPAIAMMNYLVKCAHFDPQSVDHSGNNALHYVCGISQKAYYLSRSSVLANPSAMRELLAKQYERFQETVISFILDVGTNPNIVNKKGHSPLTLCIENSNIVGIRLLLDRAIPSLEFQSSSGQTLLHFLSRIGSQGPADMAYVLEKLNKFDKNGLAQSAKRVDCQGFEFIIRFVKDFTESVKSNYHSNVARFTEEKSRQDPNLVLTPANIRQIHERARLLYEQHQQIFLGVVSLLLQLECDPNSSVQDRRTEDGSQNMKKWGVQHFLMKFPSLKLLQYLRKKIKDFNLPNTINMTPLHLFCAWTKKGSLFELDEATEEIVNHPKQYSGEKCLQFLLENGLNPNSLDMDRSTPLLYAALNGQVSFIVLLRKFGSIINNYNSKNQVALFEILKTKHLFTLQEVESLLKIGAETNYEDQNKRNSLHHLIYHAENLDNSPELCNLLLNYGARINSLDKYSRSPLFYCFTSLNSEDDCSTSTQAPPIYADKIQILRFLLNHKDINLNQKDVYQRTPLHYACQGNYFFSVIELLQRNINLDVEDYEGNTPLAICLKNRQFSQAALLIKKGVKPGFVINNGVKTSYFDYAATQDCAGVCYMLLDYGYPLEQALSGNIPQEMKKILISKYKR